MKNLFLGVTLSLLFLVPCATVSAQHIDETAHWSLGIKGGADYYRVYPFSGDRADRISWFPALTLEYSFNPIFGIGLEGGFFNYGRHYEELDYQGHTIDGIIYGSANLANLLAPGRKSSVFNAYVEAGAGVGFYSYNLGSGYTDYKATMAGTVGLNLEFELGRLWALNLGAQYRMYYDPAMGGAVETPVQFRDYTDALAVSLGLRYKFAAHKRAHMRNTTLNEYYIAPQPVIVVDETPDIEMLRRVESLERDANSNKQKIQQLEQRNQQLNQDLQKVENRPVAVVTPEKPTSLVLPNITFVTNQKELSPANRATLDQIAMMLLNNDSSWKSLEVHGYTDSTGTQTVNLGLSEQRAREAADYLISKGVKASRITKVMGHGSENPVATNSTAEGRNVNRRIEFKIVK